MKQSRTQAYYNKVRYSSETWQEAKKRLQYQRKNGIKHINHKKYATN